ncbi:MAG: F0F1 ATP synthase subunit gamma [Anaerolineae bacterium]
MQDIEEIRERRDNVEAIEPIVTSMRTVSAGSWRQALQRREASATFCRYLEWVLTVSAPNVPERAVQRLGIRRDIQPANRPLLLVISSQRGLCGAYNDVVARGADQLITSQSLQSEEVLVAALGSRAAAQLRRMGRQIDSEWALPTSRVATTQLVNMIASELRDQITEGAVDAVYVIYSPYRSGAIAPPVAERWLPVDWSMLPRVPEDRPEVTFEGDAEGLYERALRAWTNARLYRLVVDSAASEHAARFRAMDMASSNLARIIEELTLQYHTARQHAITMEMLDLAAGTEGSRVHTVTSEG